TRGSGTCFVDGETPTAVILAVQALDGGQGLVVIDHFHEAESPAPTGLSIAQDLGAAHRPVLLEQLLQLLGSDRVFEVANVKPLRHLNRPEQALHRPQGTNNPVTAGRSPSVSPVSRPPTIDPCQSGEGGLATRRPPSARISVPINYKHPAGSYQR